MKFYKMSTNLKLKTLTVNFLGWLKPEQYEEYFADYKRFLRNLNPSETKLILEMSCFAIELPSTVNKLRTVARLYRDTGFKTIEVRVNRPQKVLKEHIEHLIKLENINNMYVVFNEQ